MNLGKSKLALAKVINEHGGWAHYSANWAAQDKDGEELCAIWFYVGGRPHRYESDTWWLPCEGGRALYRKHIQCEKPIKNWHQTCLSREEYYHAYPKADADGWIEWGGGECPVDVELYVYVNYRDGCELPRAVRAGSQRWNHFGLGCDIVSYRLRNHANMHDTGAGDPNPVAEPEFCESVMRSIPEPESHEKLSPEAIEDAKFALMSESIEESKRKPTIEQLAQDYRNAKCHADRLQKEAGEAAVKAESFAVEIRKKILELQELIGITNTEKEPELVITNWRDLRVGDVIEITGSGSNRWKDHSGREMTVKDVYPEHGDNDDQVYLIGESGAWWLGGNTTWRFIRRP